MSARRPRRPTCSKPSSPPHGRAWPRNRNASRSRRSSGAPPRRRHTAPAFRAALADRDRINVIAECKRRSPSRGVLRHDYDPVAIARGYEQAGAAALSVLTEPTFFDGSLEHLAHVRHAVDLPLLRKDFIVDDYQLLEARGERRRRGAADCRGARRSDPRALAGPAGTLGLAALVEVHDADEVERARAAGADIVGVNNRNLRTLEVDMRASEACAAQLPPDVIAVSESGLKTGDDLRRMRALGYRAFLIGERFMTAPDPGDALRGLVATLGDGSHQDRAVAP